MYEFKLVRINPEMEGAHTWYIAEKHLANAIANHVKTYPHCELRIIKATDEEVAQIYRGI